MWTWISRYHDQISDAFELVMCNVTRRCSITKLKDLGNVQWGTCTRSAMRRRNWLIQQATCPRSLTCRKYWLKQLGTWPDLRPIRRSYNIPHCTCPFLWHCTCPFHGRVKDLDMPFSSTFLCCASHPAAPGSNLRKKISDDLSSVVLWESRLDCKQGTRTKNKKIKKLLTPC